MRHSGTSSTRSKDVIGACGRPRADGLEAVLVRSLTDVLRVAVIAANEFHWRESQGVGSVPLARR